MKLHDITPQPTHWRDRNGQDWLIAAGGITNDHIENIIRFFTRNPQLRLSGERKLMLSAVHEEARRRRLAL